MEDMCAKYIYLQLDRKNFLCKYLVTLLRRPVYLSAHYSRHYELLCMPTSEVHNVI